MSPSSLRHPATLRASFPAVSWLLRRSSPCKTAALPQCLFNTTVGNTGCQPHWILQRRDALETAASLSEALSVRSVIPAKPKMICKPPQERGYHIPACRRCGCGGEGEGLGEGATAGAWEPWGTRGMGRAAQLCVPIPFALYTPRSLELVWISEEETEPNPSARPLPPFPAPPSPMRMRESGVFSPSGKISFCTLFPACPQPAAAWHRGSARPDGGLCRRAAISRRVFQTFLASLAYDFSPPSSLEG